MARPFRSTAPYYSRYRPAYPPELILRLAEGAALDREARVLDLGCGPGSLAIPLAEFAGHVVAVDSEPAMIKELSREAPANVTAVTGRAEAVDEKWGSFRLVTAGRAIHWFDAPFVLNTLSKITTTVALCGDDIRESEVQSLALELAAELIDEPPIPGPRFRYTDVLRASPFSDVEVISVEVERTWTPDELIGFVYSTAAASPERLGERRAEFEAHLRKRLKGSHRERVGVDAVIGRRT